MLDLVSVVIPVSGKRYFREALDSICNQTYRNLEIILIDSSDEREGIKNILSQYDDARIRYFYQEKNGVANALNFGIGKATGQYIARMDADDIALPDRISVQVEYLENHPEVDVTASSYILINERGEYIKQEIKQFSCEEIKYELLFDNPICHPTIMFRCTIFDEGWTYHKVFAEDYDLWTRLAIDKNLSVTPDILLKYRIHADNLSNVNVLKVNDSDITSALAYMKALFGICIDTDKKYLLVRNYHLSHAAVDEVGECKEFLISQYKLLYSMYEASEIFETDQKEIINKIIQRRWKNIINISNIIYPPKELYIFPFKEIDHRSFQSSMRKIIEDNDAWIRNKQSEKVRFFLYGLGERGNRTLKRYERLHKDRLKSWELLGIIDKEYKAYSVEGICCQTCDKQELVRQEFDYILISAFEYYEEVRDELCKLNIPDKKIIRDNMLFFL